MSLRSSARAIYGRSPAKVQAFVGRLYASLPMKWHFGSDLAWAKLISTEAVDWSDRQIAEYQQRALAHILQRARSYEFYRDRGLTRELANLKPFTSKELAEFTNSVSSVDIRLFHAEHVATGGSTGEPVSFYLDRKGLAMQKATRMVHDKLVTDLNSPRYVQLRGIRYDPILPWDSQYAVRSFDGNTLYLNSYTLARDTACHFYEAWNRFKPEIVFAYPSTLAELASLIQLDEAALKRPRAIITSSESLLDDQRTLIENAIGAPIHDFYGLTECECIAFEAEHGGDYRVDCHVCLVELLVGDRQAEQGERAEIVITHLHNYSQPLIRYRTGDMAIGAAGGRLPNGSWRKLTSIEGRVQEHLVANDGARITLVAFNMHTIHWRNVLAYQFVQESPGIATMNLKVSEALSGADLRLIAQEISEKTDKRVEVNFAQVKRLFRTERGKTPRVVPLDRVAEFDFGAPDDF